MKVRELISQLLTIKNLDREVKVGLYDSVMEFSVDSLNEETATIWGKKL